MTRDADPVGDDVDAEWPVLPEWMAEQARQTGAAIASGTYQPGPPDDLSVIAARLADLRAQLDAGRVTAEPLHQHTAHPDEYADQHGDGAGDAVGWSR